MRTALVPGLITGVARWGSDGARVTLDSDLFGGVDDADQRLMVGQIVLTLADQPDIDQVDFTLGGEPMQVFRGENTLSEPGRRSAATTTRCCWSTLRRGRSSRAARPTKRAVRR